MVKGYQQPFSNLRLQEAIVKGFEQKNCISFVSFCIWQRPYLIQNELENPVFMTLTAEPVFVNVGDQESILPAYVAQRAGTTNRVVVPTRQAGIDSWAS